MDLGGRPRGVEDGTGVATRDHGALEFKVLPACNLEEGVYVYVFCKIQFTSNYSWELALDG